MTLIPSTIIGSSSLNTINSFNWLLTLNSTIIKTVYDSSERFERILFIENFKKKKRFFFSLIFKIIIKDNIFFNYVDGLIHLIQKQIHK